MKSKVKTDNSFIADKVDLRINHLPDKQDISVLDCYAGSGLIWKKIQSIKKDKNFDITQIERDKKKGVYLRGDNVKFLQSIDIFGFDVIDLDAYGVPYKQLSIVIPKIKIGTVIYITYICRMFGALNNNFLSECGYSDSMVKKIPTLFYKNGIDKFKQYLAHHGVKELYVREHALKYYIACKKEF